MAIPLSIQLSLRNTEKNKQLVVPRRDRLVLSYIVRCKLWAFSCLLRNKKKNRQLVAPRRGRLCALLWSIKRLHCFYRGETSYYTNVSVYIYTHIDRARIIAWRLRSSSSLKVVMYFFISYCFKKCSF